MGHSTKFLTRLLTGAITVTPLWVAAGCGTDAKPAVGPCAAGKVCTSNPGDDSSGDGIPYEAGTGPGIPDGTGDGVADGLADGTGDGTGDGPGDGSSYAGMPCKVREAVTQHCVLCHSSPPSYNAPMALTSAAAFQAPSVSNPAIPTYQAVNTRINSTDAHVHMPPSGSSQLDPDQLTAFNAWLAAGAATSTESCTRPATEATAERPTAERRPSMSAISSATSWWPTRRAT